MAVARHQDARIRKYARRVWDTAEQATRLEMITDLTIPFRNSTKVYIKSQMMESYRMARARARMTVERAHRARVQIQEMDPFSNCTVQLPDITPEFLERFDGAVELDEISFVSKIQELEADELAYHQIVKEYGAWAELQGNEMWQQKVKTAKGTMVRGIENGWGLNPVGEYTKAGKSVSAFEATGGVGGSANVLKGYSYTQLTPGILDELQKDLASFGYSGHQLERLARTEYTRAMNAGLLSIYQEDDMIVGYEWSAILDARTCVECAMMDGVQMDRGDPRLGDYTPPLHPHCRCEILPIFAWEQREANMDTQRTVTLYDKEGRDFTVDYIPNRINPDFLKTIRPANDSAGIKRQLITKKKAEKLRNNFVPTMLVHDSPALN